MIRTNRTVPVSHLTPYANNSRTHSKKQIAQICASINEFGFTAPVLIDEHGTIIAGHGRVVAAEKLGMDDVPCVELSGYTETQRRALVLADNRLALNADWDLDLLKVELDWLVDVDFDLGVAGFSDNELAALSLNSLTPSDAPIDDVGRVFNILIECADEYEQADVYRKLTKQGLICRVQSL